MAVEHIPQDPDVELLADLVRHEPWLAKYRSNRNRLLIDDFEGAHLNPVCEVTVSSADRRILLRAPYPDPVPPELFERARIFVNALARSTAPLVWTLDGRTGNLALVYDIALPKQLLSGRRDAAACWTWLAVGDAVHFCIDEVDRYANGVRSILAGMPPEMALKRLALDWIEDTIFDINQERLRSGRTHNVGRGAW